MDPKRLWPASVVVCFLFGSLGIKAQQAGSINGNSGTVRGAVSPEAATATPGAVPRLIQFAGVIQDVTGNPFTEPGRGPGLQWRRPVRRRAPLIRCL